MTKPDAHVPGLLEPGDGGGHSSFVSAAHAAPTDHRLNALVRAAASAPATVTADQAWFAALVGWLVDRDVATWFGRGQRTARLRRLVYEVQHADSGPPLAARIRRVWTHASSVRFFAETGLSERTLFVRRGTPASGQPSFAARRVPRRPARSRRTTRSPGGRCWLDRGAAAGPGGAVGTAGAAHTNSDTRRGRSSSRGTRGGCRPLSRYSRPSAHRVGASTHHSFGSRGQ